MVSRSPAEHRPFTMDCVLVDKVYSSCQHSIQLSQQLPNCCLLPGCIPPWVEAGSLDSSIDLTDTRCDVSVIVPSGVDCVSDITLVLSVVVNWVCVTDVRGPQ